jgi:hypothetical protein
MGGSRSGGVDRERRDIDENDRPANGSQEERGLTGEYARLGEALQKSGGDGRRRSRRSRRTRWEREVGG